MNKFAILTRDEIENSPIPFAVEDGNDGSEIVSPVPRDAPALPHHPIYGEPAARWAYKNTTGAVALWICRFERAGERKQILPLTLWRDHSGQIQWRWKGYPAPRPIFNVDMLASNVSAAAIIVEGEKAAVAAADVFPKSIVTTSPGGSQAAGKADWTPLAGRRCLIWPDADTPGIAYANHVASILTDLGCEISIIDAIALSRIAPGGGMRDAPSGWDCADAVAEWDDVSALRKIAVGLAKQFDPGPKFLSWGDFTMSADGLMAAIKGRGRDAETTIERVSAPFEILGCTRDPSGSDWGKWLRWEDQDGREHLRHVAETVLQGDPGALAASLAGEGLRVNRAHQRALATYLSGVEAKGRVTLVGRTGWHVIGNQNVFVLPKETIGPRGAETVILDSASVRRGPSYEARGTLADWQENVGRIAADHSLALLAISASLAGPLLSLAGQEGGGLNFYGPSSKGKSTLLSIAASVWGRGGSPGYVSMWKATDNGLEGGAASVSDTSLILDELGVVEAKVAAAAVYGLSNGVGKSRMARDGSLREPKTWRVMMLSSGEIPLGVKLAEDRGRQARAGQLVRLLDIPIDRSHGAFDSAGGYGDAGTLSKELKIAATTFYGTAGPAFIRKLILEKIDGAAVRALVGDFAGASLPVGSDGQVDRAAHRIGLIMAAGEIAADLGIVPWRAGVAREAASAALARWIEGRGGHEAGEERQAVEAVRLLIEQHGESRFEPIDGNDGGARPVSNRLGWRSGNGADQEWLIPSEVWRREFCEGLDPKFVARVLGERGMLEKAGDGWQPTRRIAGRVQRVYVVTAAIFEGAPDGL